MDILNENIKYESFTDMFELAKYTSSKIDKSLGRKIVIEILDNWNNVNEESKEIWINLIERAGFYPYVSNLGMDNLGIQGNLRRNWFKSSNLEDIYFHSKQKEIEMALNNFENILVSAPTSFGKSLIIEEIIASYRFENILIIQPTLALIDETRRKLGKYSEYNVVVNSKQEIKEKNIFILTAERVLEMKNLPNIDFFVVDEFYKVSLRKHDERINVLNIAIAKIMYMQPQSLFLTPNIDEVSELFIEKYNITFFKTDYSLVNSKIHNIEYKNSKEKKEKLFEKLYNLEEPSLVYVKSAKNAYKLAIEYMQYLSAKNVKYSYENDLPLIEWIEKNISNNWKISKILSYKIGIHNGDLPRHMTINQLDYFEKNLLNVLFVTTSLIEGVNTSAKNVLIYDKFKGKNPLDFFDFQNIKGRAGRMGKYFTGNIFVFDNPPQEDKFILDVPFTDQIDVSDEILLNLKDKDIRNENKDRVKEIKAGLSKELIEAFKNNTFSIQKQKDLYYHILENKDEYKKLLIWDNPIPTYEELSGTLHIAYSYLEGKISKNYTNSLSYKCLSIIGNESLYSLIKNQASYYLKSSKYKTEEKCLENAIFDYFRFLKRESGYKIPKYLMITQSIIKEIYDENMDYTYFSTLLESENVKENLMFLLDYGIPSITLKKIQSNISSELKTKESIIQSIQEIISSDNQELTKYEILILKKLS